MQCLCETNKQDQLPFQLDYLKAMGDVTAYLNSSHALNTRNIYEAMETMNDPNNKFILCNIYCNSENRNILI